MSPTIAPYGTWVSPLGAADVAVAGRRLGAVAVDGDDIYWLEGRPTEGGRNALVRRTADGRVDDVTPREMNVRTRVHEYGGGAYAVADGVVYFSNFSDQRVYRVGSGLQAADSGPPRPLTPEGDWFYADFVVDRARQQLICVREDHTGGREPVNTLVRIPLSGDPSPGDVIVSGHDFYSTPRLSPDGSLLAWIAWRHPQMPWDGTELWVADVTPDGVLASARHVAGSASESIYQPGWSPDGALFFVSDADGWWKLYRILHPAAHTTRGGDPGRGETIEAVVRNPPAAVEFGRPQWVFGTATWAFADPDRLVTAYTRAGRWHLATVHVHTGLLTEIPTNLSPQEWMAATPQHVVLVAGSPERPDAVVRLDLTRFYVEVLRLSSDAQLDPAYISTPEPIEFPTDYGRTAHAFCYPPRNKNFVAPRGERPPLIVIGHGGPTTATRTTFELAIQFWTSRGFAVADVNYSGSSGYGREYRERLHGQWGVVDVADIVNLARYLVTQGKADVRKLIVRGGSAGGYTTLAALTFYPGVFSVGASYYGISDVEGLAHDTHKFESRYLDTLIGPYPEMKEVYRARSPIHHVDRLSCALILFQGLEDKVVPPSQSQMMADAVRAKGLPVEYLTFEGEQHGFRRAETIVRALESELAFYQRVL
ncbi:MAG TPA: prolyl oligopeptidase family serine peptidase [Vicinamibacterales bacterium]